MSYRFLIPCAIALVAVAACSSPPPAAADNSSTTAKAGQTAEATPTIDVDAAVAETDEYRLYVEQNIKEGLEVGTEDLRAKIHQKWSKLHFYVIDGEVVRIKTYPHSEISKRTEEFYLRNNQLVLAVIEDNGDGARGKAPEQLDKRYYFHNGQFLTEITDEAKRATDHHQLADAEELLQEIAEYLEIYHSEPVK